MLSVTFVLNTNENIKIRFTSCEVEMLHMMNIMNTIREWRNKIFLENWAIYIKNLGNE